jgi:hypothetical protein
MGLVNLAGWSTIKRQNQVGREMEWIILPINSQGLCRRYQVTKWEGMGGGICMIFRHCLSENIAELGLSSSL